MESLATASLPELLSKIRETWEQDSAFAELVVRYTPLIKKKVSSFFASSSLAAEATQEAHIALHSAAMTYDSVKCDGVTFGLYAGVCISNRLKSFMRQTRRHEGREEMLGADRLAVRTDVDGYLAGKETLQNCLRVAREILSDLEYRVFVLQLEGYPTREIAKRLSREPKSVDNAKARIAKNLRGNTDICALFSDIL